MIVYIVTGDEAFDLANGKVICSDEEAVARLLSSAFSTKQFPEDAEVRIEIKPREVKTITVTFEVGTDPEQIGTNFGSLVPGDSPLADQIEHELNQVNGPRFDDLFVGLFSIEVK